MIWFGTLLYAADPPMPRVALQDPVDRDGARAHRDARSGVRALGMAVRVPIDLERSATAQRPTWKPGSRRIKPAASGCGPSSTCRRIRRASPAGARCSSNGWRGIGGRWPFSNCVSRSRRCRSPRFAIQAAATDLRAAAAAARLAIGGPITAPDNLPLRLIDASVAPYVDLIAVPSRAAADAAIASLKSVGAGRQGGADRAAAAGGSGRRADRADRPARRQPGLRRRGDRRGWRAARARGGGRRVARAGAPAERRGRRHRRRRVVADAERAGTGRLGAGRPPPALREPDVRDVSVLPVRRERRRRSTSRSTCRSKGRRWSSTSPAEARRRPAAIAGTVRRSTCRRRGRAVRC